MKRLDREGVYTIPIWIGLFFTSLYVLYSPTIDPLISDGYENLLAALMGLGSILCLIGVFIGNRILAYKIECLGLAMTFVALGLVGAHVDRSLIEQFTMYGSLGAIIQIGNVRMMWQLTREILYDKKRKKVHAHEG